MKRLFISGLVVFWTGTIAILVGGMVMYSQTSQNKLGADSSNKLGELNELGVLDGQGKSPDTDISNPTLAGTSTATSASDGTEYVIEKKTVQKTQYLSNTIVAEHSSKSDCWMIVEKKVYDVTEYIPFHPGGQDTIINNCGKEATNAFNTRGGSGSHSASAKALLAKYTVAAIGDAWGTVSVTEEVRVPVVTGKDNTVSSSPVTSTTPTPGKLAKYNVGSTVKASSELRVRQTPATAGSLAGTVSLGTGGTVIDGPTDAGGYTWYKIKYANGLSGWSVQDYLVAGSSTTINTPEPNSPVVTAQSCSAWTYNAWGSCQSNGKQSRTVKTSLPNGCTGGSPVTTQSCAYSAPVTSQLTMSVVSTHNSSASCWFVVSGRVYDVTQYIPFHPGGQNTIINSCGKEATIAFNTKGGGGSHSASAKTLLANYLLGDLVTAPTTAVDPTAVQCTSWTYNAWGSCQSNGSQSRTVKTSSPNGCSGGAPLISQSCTYTAPATTPPTTSVSLTMNNVATHNSSASCWFVVSGRVYDVTQYIPFHPGGQNTIINSCGKEATIAFNTKGGGGSHSASAKTLLANYLLGNLVSTPTTPVDPGAVQCTSWTYNGWGTCQSDGTQTRTVRTSSPTSCVGGSPVLSQSCTYTPPVTTPPTTSGSLTSSAVATHNTSGNCWIIVSNKVYDVTQYIPFHPGGQNTIINNCGKESTTAFNTKGGGGSHSTSAKTLLANYLLGDLVTTPTTPTATQCTAWTYSTWGSCQSNGTQSRTVNTSSPSGCTGGSPVTSQSCTYTPPATSGSMTASVVATHNSSASCWLIISGRVYDVTQYIPFHPGGTTRITNNCGKESTSLFTTNVSGGHRHSSGATNQLGGYLLGDLVTTPAPSAGQCTSWTYNAWGTCQSDSTQSRTVNTSSPSGCTGGSPVTTQSCTYTPPVVNQTHNVTVSSSGAFSPTSLSIAIGDSVRFTYTNPGDEINVSFSPAGISSMKLDHEVTSKTAKFNSAGSWTYSSNGNSGTITVQ